MSIRHFTDYDPNLNIAADMAAQASKVRTIAVGMTPCPPRIGGSIIDCDSRVLGERVPITGSPFTLNYQSFRAAGDAAMRTVRVTVGNASVPADVTQMILEIDVAGIHKHFDYPRQTNKVVEWTWDGLDAYGRKVNGSANARISVGYRYSAAYAAGSGSTGGSFANSAASGAGLGVPTGNRNVGWVQWNRSTISLGAPSAGSDGLGGWTLSPHHFFDPTGFGTVYLGDGQVMPGDRRWPIVTLLAGNNSSGAPTDGAPALGTHFVAHDLARAPDGTMYFSHFIGHVTGYPDCYSIWKIDAQGNLLRVGGLLAISSDAYQEGVSARLTPLYEVRNLQVGSDGSLYFAMNTEGGPTNAVRVCRIGADGIIRTIAGNGAQTATGNGDGGQATSASFIQAQAVAISKDGSFFVSDGVSPGARIRRVSGSGTIQHFAGTGAGAQSGTTALAVQAPIDYIDDMLVDSDGVLYLAESENTRIRKITPDGIISTVAGGSFNFKPTSLARGPDGSFYCGSADKLLYRVDPEGSVSVVGGGSLDMTNGVSPRGTNLGDAQGIHDIAVAPDGTIYVAAGTFGIYRIGTTLPIQSAIEVAVPSLDGSEVYYFDRVTGRHERTRDAITGGVLYRFEYANNQLAKVVDSNNDETLIERWAGGLPKAIVAPYGQRTELETDGAELLSSIANPAAEVTVLENYANGLLHFLTDPRAKKHVFEYASDGRLHIDSQPQDAGGVQTLTYAADDSGRAVGRGTAEGRSASYRLVSLGDGSFQRRTAGENHLTTVFTDSASGHRLTSLPDGTTHSDSLKSDPAFFNFAPFSGLAITRLPSGLARAILSQRTGPSVFDPPFSTGEWMQRDSLSGKPVAFSAAYNRANRTWRMKTPVGRVTTVTVDAVGRPLTLAVGGLDDVHHQFDSRGRLTSSTQGGRQWLYGYNGLGLLESVQDPRLRTSTFSYYNSDRLKMQNLPGGRWVRFHYDASGNVDSLTPPGRPRHGFGYTGIDLNSTYTPPTVPGVASPATSYEYNKDGQLKAIHRPDGVDVTLGYESGTDRLETIAQPRGNVQLGYDTRGRLGTLSSPDGVTLAYGYDGALMTSETWGGAVQGAVSRSYDNAFLPKTQTIAGQSVAFGYDNDLLLTQAGALTIDRRGDNGIVSGTKIGVSDNVTTTESQTNVGELWKFEAKYLGNSLYSALYNRDSLGRITGISETVNGTTKLKAYAYSDTGFLTTVTVGGTLSERYAYDGNGNRLRFDAPGDFATADYDGQDRLLSYGDARYEWTAAGDLARKLGPGGVYLTTEGQPYVEDTTSYSYDALGNLTRVITPARDTISYLVDGRSRRVARLVNRVVTHKWLYEDRLRIAAELDASNTVVSRFVYGERPNVPEYMVKNGHTYRMILDHLGSVRMVVDASDGSIAQQMDFDAWGNVTQDTNAGFQPFGYAGGLYDAATGLVRFGARDYEARTGRWTSRDPRGFADGNANTYLYALGRPTTASDPSGRIDDEGIANRHEHGHSGLGDLPPFKTHGKWGGPAYGNGLLGQDELSNYPYLPIHDGYAPPADAEDECYREHDVNLRNCARLTNLEDRKRCRAEADLDLASCLYTLADRDCRGGNLITTLLAWYFHSARPNGTGPGKYAP